MLHNSMLLVGGVNDLSDARNRPRLWRVQRVAALVTTVAASPDTGQVWRARAVRVRGRRSRSDAAGALDACRRSSQNQAAGGVVLVTYQADRRRGFGGTVCVAQRPRLVVGERRRDRPEAARPEPLSPRSVGRSPALLIFLEVNPATSMYVTVPLVRLKYSMYV